LTADLGFNVKTALSVRIPHEVPFAERTLVDPWISVRGRVHGPTQL
jgi:hypothetical protein